MNLISAYQQCFLFVHWGNAGRNVKEAKKSSYLKIYKGGVSRPLVTLFRLGASKLTKAKEGPQPVMSLTCTRFK